MAMKKPMCSPCTPPQKTCSLAESWMSFEIGTDFWVSLCRGPPIENR